MDATARIETALEAALAHAGGPGAPPRLVDALRYAVFPGGARVRPHLCLAVAEACGGDAPALGDAAAAAVEFLHCASLVHDDLPCFDDADERRGKPSVHVAFGEPLAVLAGDALIVLAFDTVARAGLAHPARACAALAAIAAGVGAPAGIVAGQAWESEPEAPLELYHREKTGALFVAAAVSGALAAGADPAPWAKVGARLGAAYQIADDLLDAAQTPIDAGKPQGRDALLARPNAHAHYGLAGAVRRLEALVGEAVAAIPPCPGAGDLRALVEAQAVRLVPKPLRHLAL